MSVKVLLLQATAMCVLAGLLIIASADRASAQNCQISIDDIDFGPIDVTLRQRYRTTGNMNIRCTGGVVNAGRTVYVCPNIGPGGGGPAPSGHPRRMRGPDLPPGIRHLMRYGLFQNAEHTTSWGSFLTGLGGLRPPIVEVLLNSQGIGSVARVMRYQIANDQPRLPAGRYLSIFAGMTHTFTTYGFNRATVCEVGDSTFSTRPGFTVEAQNIATCRVTASRMDFGTEGLLDANVDTTNSIDVTCTFGVDYSIGLSGGMSGAVNPELRKMRRAGEEITYAIYQDAARTLPWGDTIGVNTQSGRGDGSPQSYTGYGRVPPQPTPGTGTYRDTVLVTVTY